MSQIIDRPLMPPGGCINCGCKAPRDGRKYVDTNIQVFNYGRIYICEHCIGVWAKLFGLVAESTFKTMADAFNDHVKEIDRLKEENERLRGIFTTLNDLGIDPISSGPSLHNDAAEPREDKSAVEPLAQSSPKVVPRSSGRQARPTQPNAEQGPSNVPSSNRISNSPGVRL